MPKILVRIIVLICFLFYFMSDVKAQITYPYKFVFNGNPLERNHGASDPSVHVWDGTVWIYTSKDHAPGYSAMDGYHAYSSSDLVNWVDHGDVFNSSMLNTSSWGNTQKGWMWAPTAARKKDSNGVWTYYLYYPHNKAAVGAGEEWVTGVAIAPNPWGPFTDLGILGGWPSWKAAMDPMVFIDDDGQAYIYANSAKVSRLNPDMVSLAEAPRNITYAPSEVTNDQTLRFSEGSYMHKKDGNYYFSFSNFHNEKFQGFYAMGKNPYGPFEWKGPMAPKPVGAQDHHSIIDFKGQWYYFYHISLPNIPAIKDGQTRITCFDKLFYNSDGTIKLVKHTQGPTFNLTTNSINGYIKTDTPGPVFESGTTVTVTGIGELGYAFSSWSGDLSGNTNPTKIVMNSDKSISASFISVPTHTLTTSATNGSISLDPPGGVYSKGVEVTITALNSLGFAFNNWSGDLTGSANPSKIIIDGNKSVTANFAATQTYKLITQAENGSVSLNPAGGVYNKNTVVEIKGKANTGYVFAFWTGDALKYAIYLNQNYVTMDSDKIITANFLPLAGTPEVSFVKPNDGDKFSESTNLSIIIDARDTDGTISNVKLFINETLVRQDNAAPYEWGIGDAAVQNLPKGIYKLRAEATDNSGKIGTKTITISVGNVSNIHSEKNIPTETTLFQNYPNPFNPETTISYQLSTQTHVRLTIRNMLGQEIIKLLERDQSAGQYSLKWNGKDYKGNKVASGVYFYMLEVNNSVYTKKLLLLQ